MKEEGSPTSRSQDSVRGFLDLALRCETEEPGRELDAAIYETTKGVKDENRTDPSQRTRGSILLLDEGDRLNWLYVPAFTTSLDAAVTLIADGVEYSLSNLYWIARAEVGLNLNDGSHFGEHKGALMPMALCAAALRARAEIGK